MPSDREVSSIIPRPQRMGHAVFEAILQQLLSLEIAPNERISVDNLARQLGVSQTPIREALTRLESQGLVKKTHLVGYRAAPQLTNEEFGQLYDARILLEPFVAAQAALRVDKATLDHLEQLINDLAAPDVDDTNLIARTARADAELHHTIAVASGNMVIASILDNLQARVQFALFRHRVQKLNLGPSTDEHRRILGALRDGDAELSAEAMRQHLSASRQRYWPVKAPA